VTVVEAEVVAEAVAVAVEAAISNPYHEFSSEVWNTMSDAAKKAHSAKRCHKDRRKAKGKEG
jgi:hypothetical protein